ncbi:ribonuclease H-like domain-containing protein [Tricharina praecox]|uniref:ribonuclease H-like domain-containing protein n=1 Tax=Tricharina praecox TaxID=43433 RepID=UPI002220659B|nr:ribonuclease H-like domain-containing protein [Tricharina praecox]KAI5849906.1 ribonuclease H-like domain-containing protein [Tricharina praecox]
MLAPEGPSVSHDCDVCEREFKNPAALQAHINHSKFHEKLVRQQRPSQPAVASVSQPVPIVDEFASVSVVRGIDSLKHGNNNWTVVPDSQQAEALQALKNHCHSTIDLLKHNYVLKPVTAEDIDDLRKCKNCGDRKKKASYPCIFHPPQRKPARNSNNGLPPSCCGQRGRGCKQLPVHDFGPADRRSLKKFRTYARTPAASYPQTSKRRAVTLDCEMAGVARGQAEVILLCAADYMTGETLVNSLVRPTSRVVDWRSRFSGVTAEAMATATEQGDTLDGWRGARAELWKHVDADTILVGHSLQHDLDVLRMIHTRVVDSAILARNAVGSARQWGLKALCGEFLGIDIQNGGLRGHDCMEDALAAREVVLWCLQNPSLLAGWGEMVNEQEERKRQEEADKREKMKIKTERTLPKAGEEGQGDGMRGGSSSAVGGNGNGKMKKQPKAIRPRDIDDVEYSSDEIEILRWADIAEDLGYPHPDHYDPWSD